MERIRISSGKEQVRVAFCGTRGLPANYGGFETAVDQISRRFVDSGIECEVFCRESSSERSLKTHRGRHLTYVKGCSRRSLETFVTAFQTGWHLWRHRKKYSHVFWFNNANLPGILMTRMAGLPMSVNTDGLEWRRAKWSWPFKAYYYLSSLLIGLVCPTLISDSRGIQSYYRRHFFRNTCFVPYGAPTVPRVSERDEHRTLTRLGLEPGKYFLQITRLEPDNLPLKIAEAFRESGLGRLGYQMVFVGYKDATPYAHRLVAYSGSSNIQVREAIYDQEILAVLRKNCFCYVHGNSVGGTNPALLEAMATCPRIIAIDCEFSREVLGPNGVYFPTENIADKLQEACRLEDQTSELKRRVAERYQWQAVAESYMQLSTGIPAEYVPEPVVVPVSTRDRRQLHSVMHHDASSDAVETASERVAV
ncbi:MAG: glycosyltransferase family 1 protein [bacterium]|nr:glycosyltransferase family 1 protein [bacterium]